MVRNKDRWSQLSMKQRADLIRLYINNGISSLAVMREDYNGVPYSSFNSSDYDYYNAHPSNAPTEKGGHWSSRNPKTGQLLKREGHPTFDLMIEGEKQAGYNIIKGLDGNLYSVPNEPSNYIESHNSFEDGGAKDTYYYDVITEPAVVKAFKSQKDYNRYYGEQFGKQIARKRDKVANNIVHALEYTPFVGDGIDITNAAASINEGDYSKAAMLAGLALLPNAIESIGKGIVRPFKNARRIKRMKETYTGVRHIPDRNNLHITMDDNFPTYNGTIWSSEAPEYARQWVYDTEGKVYKVLTDPSDLKMVETPMPNSGEYYPWNSLPYELKEGKLSSRPSMLVDSHILPDMETAVKYKRGIEYGELSEKEIRELETNFLKGRANSGTDITTDNIVEQSYIQGFDGVNFKGVYDGPSIKDGLIVDIPINETVLNPHVPHIVLPENKSKWSLLFKDLDDLTIKKFGGEL